NDVGDSPLIFQEEEDGAFRALRPLTHSDEPTQEDTLTAAAGMQVLAIDGAQPLQLLTKALHGMPRRRESEGAIVERDPFIACEGPRGKAPGPIADSCRG